MFENHPFFELCNSKVKNWVRFLFERLRYWYWKNSKNDWKTLCCCYYVWWPTSNICNLSFAKSRKDHYLSKRSKYRIIYCHKITAFDKKEGGGGNCQFRFSNVYFSSKINYKFEFSRQNGQFGKSWADLLNRESTILLSEIEARKHLPVSKSRSNKICQVLQQNCERLIMVA